MENNTRSAWWSLTINNPTGADEDCIRTARMKGWTVKGQLEKGQNGTEHYQIALYTKQQRFSAVKKVFPRAHIEPARNPTALVQYCEKEDTRAGELPNTDLYLPLHKVFQHMAQRNSYATEDGLIDMWRDQRDRKKTKLACNEWIGRHLLDMFDDTIRALIRQKYVVEMLAVNPQVRSAVKNYGIEILIRARESIDEETKDGSSESRSSSGQRSPSPESTEEDGASSHTSPTGSVL